MNKAKKWKYGYDKDNDVVVISHTGQIGEIYEIEGLKIALPKAPSKIYEHPSKKWTAFENPKELI